MDFIKIFITTVMLLVGLKAYSPMDLASLISSSNINMQYYFFAIDNNAFLVKEKSDKTYALWYYTLDRKWQPLHNASAFDGFEKATINLDRISVNKSSEQVIFGSMLNSNISDTVKKLLQSVENKTATIGWYFWVDDKAFLIRKKSGNEISVWHYTNDRKWQPVHNANAFDGFPKAEKTLENVTFNAVSHTLSTGSVINANGQRTPPTPFAQLSN